MCPQCWGIMTIVAMRQHSLPKNSLSVTPAGSAVLPSNLNMILACQIKVAMAV